jgi:hypothetical protein
LFPSILILVVNKKTICQIVTDNGNWQTYFSLILGSSS